MTDETDRAQERDQLIRSSAIAQTVADIRLQALMPGKLVCDCGDPISDARLKAVPNATRCVECQSFFEAYRMSR